MPSSDSSLSSITPSGSEEAFSDGSTSLESEEKDGGVSSDEYEAPGVNSGAGVTDRASSVEDNDMNDQGLHSGICDVSMQISSAVPSQALVSSQAIVSSQALVSSQAVATEDEEVLRQEISKQWATRVLSGTSAALSLTPLGASTAYFSKQETWNHYLSRVHTEDLKGNFDEDGIVSLLFRSARKFDCQLKDALSTNDRSIRVLARHAWRGVEFQKSTMPEFLHGFMRVLIADRMAWCLSERSDMDDRPTPVPHMEPGNEKQIEAYMNVFKLHLEWDKTIETFLGIWNKYKENKTGPSTNQKTTGTKTSTSIPPPVATQTTSTNQDSVDPKASIHVPGPSPSQNTPTEQATDHPDFPHLPPPTGQTSMAEKPADATVAEITPTVMQKADKPPDVIIQRKAVLESLMSGIKDAEQRVRLAKVENNFCQAALALFALAQMEVLQRELPEGSEEVPTKLILVLKKFYPDLPESLKGLDDFDLLRPLYVAVAVSPVCLLTTLQFKQSGSTRISLSQIIQSMGCTILRPDKQRRDIEYDLMRLICRMAVHGREEFDPTMVKVLQGWEELNILHSGHLTRRSEAIEIIDLGSRWAQLKNDPPVSLRVVQTLCDNVEPVTSQSRKWKVIDLTKDDPVDWVATEVKLRSVKREPSQSPAPESMPVRAPESMPVRAPDQRKLRNIKAVKYYEAPQGHQEIRSPRRMQRKNKSSQYKSAEVISDTEDGDIDGDGKEDDTVVDTDGGDIADAEDDGGKRDTTSPKRKSPMKRRAKPWMDIDDNDSIADPVDQHLLVPDPAYLFEAGGEWLVDHEMDLQALDTDIGMEAAPFSSADKTGYQGTIPGTKRPAPIDETARPAKRQRTESELTSLGEESDGSQPRSSVQETVAQHHPAPIDETARLTKNLQTESEITSLGEESDGGQSRSSVQETVAQHHSASIYETARLTKTLQTESELTSLGEESDVGQPRLSVQEGQDGASQHHPVDGPERFAEDVHSEGELQACGLRAPLGHVAHDLPRVYIRLPAPPKQEPVPLKFFRPLTESERVERGHILDGEGYLLNEEGKADYGPDDFVEVTHDVQFWPAMEEALEEIKDIMEDGEQPNCGWELYTFSHRRWERMTFHQRNIYLKRGTIHIVGRPTHPPHGITGLGDPRLANLIDLDANRQCINLAVRRTEDMPEEMATRRLTIREFLAGIESSRSGGKPRLCCNTLDIPLLHNFLPLDFDDFSKYAHQDFKGWTPYTRLGLKSLATQWALAAHASAYSRIHIDAAGYATHAHMYHGKKAWWVARSRPYYAGPNGFNAKLGRFQCAYLSEGDDLIMPPNTAHAVLTLEDSIAIGGHFYSYRTMERTLHALVQEHYFGSIATNTEHTRAPLLLMKGFMSRIKSKRNEYSNPAYGNDPSEDEFAALLVLLKHLPKLWPDLPPDSVEGTWHGTAQFIEDYRILEEELEKYLRKVPKDARLLDALATCDERFLALIQIFEVLRRSESRFSTIFPVSKSK